MRAVGNRRGRRSHIVRAAAHVEALEARRLLAQSIWAYPGADGKLLYKPLPLGDKIGDYSNVGYMGGTVAIPDVPAKITVSPVDGDDQANIQNAINFVQGLAPDANGFRGAVLLAPGIYEIPGTLSITASGVVLRGSGQGQTTLLATGTQKDSTVFINGNGARTAVSGTTKTITDKYVPLGAISFTVSNTTGLAVGDSVVVHRPTTANWIHDIGMDRLDNPWTSRNVDMDRTITRIDGNVITLDAPVTHALDQNYGGGTIWKYTATGRLSNVGVEYITGESTFDPALLSGSDRVDENHAEHFITVDGVVNGWVRNVTSKYYGYSCVNMTGPSKWVTVQDAQCLDPVSVVTGGRRYSFNMGDSTNVLWKNLYTRDGRHDYVQGSEVTGPNVVVDSRADKARADTGPHHRYSTGTLWDNLDVNGNAINIQNRWNSGTGHGWAGANQVVWNSEANSFIVQNIGYPVTSAWNWAIGNVGTVNNGNLTNGGAPTGTQGIYDSHGTKVDTRSLFHAQMAEKLAHESWMLREVRLGDADNYVAGDAADSPTLADAAWRSAIQAASGHAPSGTDTVANNQLVPLTFNFSIAPGTYVVGASLSLGLKSAGNNTNGDTIYFEDASRRYTWAQLGVVAPGLSQGAAVIDLSKFLAALQDGKLNVAVSGNTAIDWATLNFQTASTAQPQQTAITAAEDAYVDQTAPTSNFGATTSLYTKLNDATDNRESYLKFDLAGFGSGTYVTRAYLRLVPTAVGVNATTFGSGVGAMFNRVSLVADNPASPWTEGTINWSNKPASGEFFREFLSYPNEPVMVDVTPLVRAAAQAGDSALSLRINSIVNDDNSQITFASSENANVSFRPQLVIQAFRALTPVSDATVRGGSSAALNFGGDADLAVKNDSSTSADNDREAYLRFDLTGLSSSPAAAFLRLTPLAVPAALQHAAALVPNDAWSETGITWNNKPGFTSVLGTWTPAMNAATDVPVGSHVAEAYATDKLLSMKVYSATASAAAPVQYHAREAADASLRPTLILSNLAPLVTSIPDVPGTVNTPTAPRWFGVWDAETAAGALTVTAASSNPALLPNGNITFGGSGPDRSFALTPAAGQSGSSTVTITVTDPQGRSATTAFQYVVENTVVISGDQSSPNQDDVFKLARNGSFLDIFRNDMVTPVVHADYPSAANYVIQGLGGNDLVLLDLAGGNPIPSAGLSIDGGGGTDVVSLIGGNGADAVTLQDGAVVVGGNAADVVAGTAEELHLLLGAGGDTVSTVGGNAAVATSALLLNVNAGTVIPVGALPDFTDVHISDAAARFYLNGQDQTIDVLSGSGGVGNGAGASTPATLTLGAHGGSGTFAGTIGDVGWPLSLTKVGAGTQTLSGGNSYSGVTILRGGTIASGNSASLANTNSPVVFDGGTFRVTASGVSSALANKYSTNTGFAGAGGTFEIDPGVTFTVGTAGGPAALRTAGGGFSGGGFRKTGGGTLRIISNNGQQDDPFDLVEGTIVLEAASGLGAGDPGVRLNMHDGTSLVLRQNVNTNFATPIHVAEAGATVNLVLDRSSSGGGPAHSLNALTSSGMFQLIVTRGANVTSGAGTLSLGAVTLGGQGIFDVGGGASVAVTGSLGGAFGVTKTGAGSLFLSGANSYTGVTQVNDGVMVLEGSLTTSSAVNVAGGLLRVAPNTIRVIRTPSLSVTGSGRLDLTDNKLILAGGAAQIGSASGGMYDGIAGLIQRGCNGGAWDGLGLITSQADAATGLTTLGISTADAAGYAGRTFGGVNAAGGDLLVMYTYAGDVNLDGAITGDDYSNIDFGILFDGMYGYANGDFNCDGYVTGDDYSVIDLNILLQGPPIPT